MNPLKLLLVEDDVEQVNTYRAVLDDYSERLGREIDMEVSQSLREAKDSLDGSIDATVVDMDLGGGASDGEAVIAELRRHFRVPVAVYTGIAWGTEEEPPIIGVFTKGEYAFEDVLDRIWDIFETGLTRIMGGRGLLEKQLGKVFSRNLLPSIDNWIAYGKVDPERTRRALLRYALGHLTGELDGDESPCYPEEVYLAPPVTINMTTGSLANWKVDGMCNVVLTPACDLALRNGQFKTNRIVLVGIVSESTVFDSLAGNAKAINKYKLQLRTNNYANYYHWLPKCGAIDGGFIDFRHVQSVPKEKFNEEYEFLNVRISPGFIKDIVSRFSSFYARQGQPVIG